jgi:transcriptional regulator with XRE-family HTH domain
MGAQDSLNKREAVIAAKKPLENGTEDQVKVGGAQYSRQIGNRLSLAMRARRWSQTQLADELGVTNNTLGRIIAGQERLNMNLCCRAMELMDFDPSLLLSEEPIPGSWTGFPAIDAMLADIYGETSQSGVEALGKYVTGDYLCCSHHYTKNDGCDLEDSGEWEEQARFKFKSADRDLRKRVWDKAHFGSDLIGIPYELERKQNLLGSMGTRYVRKVASAVLIDEDCVFVQVGVQRRMIDNDALESWFNCGDVFYLKNSFMSISKGASVRIRRKMWFKLSGNRKAGD